MYLTAIIHRTINCHDNELSLFCFELQFENQSFHKLNVKMNAVCYCQTYKTLYSDIIFLVICLIAGFSQSIIKTDLTLEMVSLIVSEIKIEAEGI